MSTFPTSRPTYAGFTSSHTLAIDNHAAQHNAEQGDIGALSDKVGLGASTPISGMLLRGNGSGTSSWAQAVLTSDVSGVLPVANGGTGITSLGGGVATFLGTPTSANLASAVSDETGTGSLVFANTPTLITPTVGDFTNAQHNHSNAAGGGQISNSGISGLNTEKLANLYKFYVYRNAALSTGTVGAFAYDAKLYDISSNVDVITNKGRFTVPVAGYYQFVANILSTIGGTPAHILVSITKNGTEYVRLQEETTGNSANFTCGGTCPPILLAVNDYIEVGYNSSTTNTIVTTAVYTWFSGWLVSAT